MTNSINFVDNNDNDDDGEHEDNSDDNTYKKKYNELFQANWAKVSEREVYLWPNWNAVSNDWERRMRLLTTL